MTTNSSRRGGNGIMQSPAIGKLKEAAGAYAAAQGVKLAGRAGKGISGLTNQLENVSENGGNLGPMAQVAKGAVTGDSAPKSMAKSAASSIKDKVKGLFGRGKGSGQAKSMNIVEDIDVGVPRSVA